jgi:hypothetical protein
MSLYSFLNKDHIVYDKFNHFINDPRFSVLINDYLNSDIDDFYALSANSNTRIYLNKDKLVVSVNPLPQPINSYDHGYPYNYIPIAIITLDPTDLRDVDDRFHNVLDRTIGDLEELLYQGQ